MCPKVSEWRERREGGTKEAGQEKRRKERGAPTCQRVDFVQEDDGGRRHPGALEGLAEQRLALPDVPGGQEEGKEKERDEGGGGEEREGEKEAEGKGGR